MNAYYFLNKYEIIFVRICHIVIELTKYKIHNDPSNKITNQYPIN